MSDSIVSQSNITDTITLIDEITSLTVEDNKPEILFIDETTSLIINNNNSTVITSSIQGPPGSLDLESPVLKIPLFFGILSSFEYVTAFQGLQTINQFPYTQSGGAKYIIYASKGVNRQICELLIVHDNEHVLSVEYANIITSELLGTFSTEIVAGDIILMVDAPQAGITYRMMRTLINN